MPSSEQTLVKVEDSKDASVNELCLSVKSISLTATSAEKVIQQTAEDREKSTTEQHVLDSADRDDDETSGIDQQLLKLDGQQDISPVDVISIRAHSEEANLSRSEKDAAEEKTDQKIKQEPRTENAEDSGESSAVCIVKQDRNEPIKREEDRIGFSQMRRCVPQEHEETADEFVAQVRENDEPANELVPRGPPGGIPILPGWTDQNSVSDQAMYSPTDRFQLLPQYEGLPDGYGNAPKYRRPQPEYFPLMNGGNILVQNSNFQFGGGTGTPCFLGGLGSPEPEPVVPPPVIDFAASDVNSIVSDFLQIPVSPSLEDFVDDMPENVPSPTETPLDVFTAIPAIPTRQEHGTLALSPSSSFESAAYEDTYSDCISPDFDRSPENPPAYVAMSPTSTADSGLAEELDDIMDFINREFEDFRSRDRQRQASGSEHWGSPGVQSTVENPHVGKPNVENFGVGNTASNPAQNPTTSVLPGVIHLQPSGPISPVVSTAGPESQVHGCVTCILVSNVATPSVPVTAAPSRKPGYREILPRPPDYSGFPVSTSIGLLIVFAF